MSLDIFEPEFKWLEICKTASERRALLRLEQLIARLLPDPKTIHRAKAVRMHDPVWGTCEFDAHETAMIDTRLFQRLRRIKQLGGTSLVFPAAIHTRYEHSLGVAHIAGKMVDAISLKGAQIGGAMRSNIRFAALCHDLGHGPFSHCSEKILATLPPMPRVLKKLKKSNPGEAMSWLISISPPMRNFVETINERFSVSLNCDLIANLICGNLPPAQRYLSEILHGPIDADKIDYLQRDSMFTGIPARLDYERMLLSMEPATTKTAAGKEEVRLAGIASGALAFLQIIQHKTHLHTVVYHHSAVRSFTAMLNAALRYAINDKLAIAGEPISDVSDILRLNDETIFNTASKKSDSPTDQLLAAIHDRNLYKTVARFEPNDKKSAKLDLDKVAASLANHLGIDEFKILIDPASQPSFKEASNLLIRRGNDLKPLGKILELTDWATPLRRNLGNHLIIVHRDYYQGSTNKILPALKKLWKVSTKDISAFS